jgi:uncharacterized repeat protein (TIGR01451 family)
MRAKLFISIALLVAAFDTVSAGPTVTLSVPSEVLINEDFTFTATFDNTTGPVGYGPFIDLILPAGGIDFNATDPTTSAPGPCDGITYVPGSAQMVGVIGGPVPLTATTVSAPCQPGACATIPHPYTANGINSILVPAGAQLVTIQLPFGMFQPNQPKIVIKVTAHVSKYADVNAPLNIYARAGFQFATTPNNDQPGDPLRLSPGGVGNCTTWTASAPVTPVLFTFKVEDRLAPNPGPCFDGVDNGQDGATDSEDPECKDGKTYEGPENETATGPNFPHKYKIILNVANGMTVTNLNVQDCIPNNMVVTNVSSAATIPPPSPPPPFGPVNSPNNCLTFNYSSITGGPSATDVVIEVEFYIPETDANGTSILGTSCKVAHSINDVKADGDWIPIDPRDWGGSSTATPQHVTSDTSSQDHDLSDKCIAIQKSVKVFTDTGAHGPTPGDTLEYELDFQISDFKTVGDLKVEDFLSDGQQIIQTGPMAPTLTVTDQVTTTTTTGTFLPGSDLIISSPSQNPPLPVALCPCPDKGTKLTFQVSTKMTNLASTFPRHVAGVLTGGYAVPGTNSNIPATGKIVFYATILDKFSNNYSTGDQFVDKDDPLINCVTITGVLRKNIAPLTAVPSSLGTVIQDDSKTAIAIVTDTIKKSVYAIKRNGNFVCGPSGPACVLPPAAPDVHPGDEVTFRIEKTIPSSDAERLTIQDWLPKPIFDVNDPDANGAGGPSWNGGVLIPSCAPPPPPPGNACRFTPSSGPGGTDTLGPPFLSGFPKLAPQLGTNSLLFNYGPNFNDTNNQPRTIDLLFTSTVTYQPFADGLYLTNEAQECEFNTFRVRFCQTAIAGVNLREPNLRIRKGVIATDNPHGLFSQPGSSTVTPPLATAQAPSGVTFNLNGFSGQINSTNLLNLINSDLSNVDANDWVTFAIVIENQGGHPAYDVKLTDTIPACLTNISPISVTDGAHTSLPGSSFTITTSGSGFTFTLNGTAASIPANSTAANGTNIIVITFKAQLPPNIQPGCCDNVAKLTHYASQPNGPDFVAAGFTPPFQDSATVCVNPTLTKSVVATSEAHTAPQISTTPQTPANTPQVAIGEIVRYRLLVLLPEGGPLLNFSVTDALPAGMKFMNDGSARLAFISNTNGSFNITHGVTGIGFDFIGNETILPFPMSLGTVPTGNITGGATCGAPVTFKLGTIQNNDNDTDLEYVVIEFNALVCNVASNTNNTPLPNTFSVSVNGNQIGATSNAINVVVVEPKLTISKAVSPATVIQGGTASYTVTLTNGPVQAFDVQFTDTLPPGLTFATGSAVVSGNCSNPVTSSTAPSVTCSGVPANGVVTIKYNAVANTPACPATLTNQAKVTWTSLPGNGTPVGVNNTTGSITPGLSGAAPDGERNGVTPLLTLNNYFATTSTPVTVSCPSCATPPPGMVSWWPLDETAGTQVADIAGNPPNNGTSMPGAINSGGPSSLLAKVKNGFLFCGQPTSKFVTVPDKPILNFGTAQNFSIDAWIKTSSTSGFQMIVDKLNWPPTAGYRFYVDNTNVLKFDVGPGASFQSTTVLTPGNWYHVAVTVDRTKPFVTFYINGAPDQVAGTPTSSFNASNTGLALLMGGTYETQLPLACDYVLDEVEIFKRVLTQTEIQSIINAGPSGKCKCYLASKEVITCNANGTFSYTFTLTNLSSFTASGVTFAPISSNVTITPSSIPIPPLTAGSSTTITGVTIGGSAAVSGATVCFSVGLTTPPPASACRYQHCITLPTCQTACAPQPAKMVSWWPLNETSGNTVVDIKSGHNGTTSANIGADPSSSLAAPSKVGNALFFMASKATVPGNPYNFGASNFSIDAWVRGGNPGTAIALGIVDKLDTTANPRTGFAFFVDGGKVQLLMGDGTASGATYSSSGPNGAFTYSNTIWQHVAVTVQRIGGSPIGTFYINGAPAGTFVPTPNSVNNNVALLIGNYRLNPGTCPSCDVALDEIEIFDAVVSPVDIKAIFDAGSLGKCP